MPKRTPAPSAPDVGAPPVADPVADPPGRAGRGLQGPECRGHPRPLQAQVDRRGPLHREELAQVKEMAGNPNLPTDRDLIDRVVRGLAARLTDRRSIQSLLEGPPHEAPKADPAKKGAAAKRSGGDGGKAIQTATTNLLEPIFLARGSQERRLPRRTTGGASTTSCRRS